MVWKWIKIPKAATIIAFFMPWLTVSCSGQPVMTATGWELITGNAHFLGQAANHSAENNQYGILPILILSALVITIFGQIISLFRNRNAYLASLIASSSSLIVIVYSTHELEEKVREASASQSDSGQPMAAAISNMLQFNWQSGYWLAVLC